MRTELTADCRLVDAELDERFGSDTPTLSGEAQRHLQECARCRSLWNWIDASAPRSDLSPALQNEIESQLKRSLKPVKARPSIRTLATQFAAAFLLFVSPGIVMMGAAGFHEAGVPQVIGITLVLALAVALLSLSLAWQITPGSLHRVPPKTAPILLSAGFLLGIALLFPWSAPEAFLARGWPCLKMGLLAAIPAAVLFWVLARRGAPVAMGTLGGTLGGIAGLLGATILQFACSRQDAGHLLVWHGGILLVSIAVGVLVARTIVRFIEHRD